MRYTLRALLAVVALVATTFCLQGAVKQYTVACSDVIVSNDVPVIYIKGRPMHVKVGGKDILEALKRVAAKAKSGKKDCKTVIAIEDGIVRGVVQ